MDKSHPVNSPMVVRSLEVNKDPFHSKEENEELLGPGYHISVQSVH